MVVITAVIVIPVYSVVWLRTSVRYSGKDEPQILTQKLLPVFVFSSPPLSVMRATENVPRCLTNTFIFASLSRLA